MSSMERRTPNSSKIYTYIKVMVGWGGENNQTESSGLRVIAQAMKMGSQQDTRICDGRDSIAGPSISRPESPAATETKKCSDMNGEMGASAWHRQSGHLNFFFFFSSGSVADRTHAVNWCSFF